MRGVRKQVEASASKTTLAYPSLGRDGAADFRLAPPVPGGVASACAVGPTDAIIQIGEWDERQLYNAIKALDSFGKTIAAGPEPSEDLRLHAEQSVRSALSFLLHMISPLNIECASASASKQHQSVATACTSRILGCLKRFIAAYSSHARSLSACCELNCHHRFVTLTLLLMVFTLSNVRQIAKAIVAEGFEEFLLDVAKENNTRTTPLNSNDESIRTSGQQSNTSSECIANQLHQGLPIDLEDLFCTIDPFDWCSQSISMTLINEKREDIFLLPIGTRSMCYLLDRKPLPNNEVQEYSLRLHLSRSLSKSSQRQGNIHTHHPRKPTKLPSIFEFSTKVPGIRDRPVFCYAQVRLRQNGENDLTERAWSVVLNTQSQSHLVLRCLTTLASRLPERSTELRKLLKTINRCAHIVYGTISNPLEDAASNEFFLTKEIATTMPLHQLRAISTSTLRRLAKTTLMTSENRRTMIPDQTEDGIIPVSQVKGSQLLSLRLKSAKDDAKNELTEWQARSAGNKSLLDAKQRSKQRRRVYMAIVAVEELRESLARGLEILRVGRFHPDPTQSFENWVNSLPTIESRERDYQLEMEMRQRQTLEQQYQYEVRRRRERSERELMTSNDSDVVEFFTNSLRVSRFVEIQTELRELEDVLEDQPNSALSASKERANITANASTGSLLIDDEKQKAKLQREAKERARCQQLRQREQEGRECVRMHSEDLYFAERALRAQEHAKKQGEIEAEKLRTLRQRQLEAQERKIAEMREREQETKQSQLEMERTRFEEHLSRQRRFFLVEQEKMERQTEQVARKRMAVEEHETRARWQILQRAAEQEEAAERRRRRAQERSQRRQKKPAELEQPQQNKGTRSLTAGWLQCWDDAGNAYYYNTLSGVSQWEPPGPF